MKPSEALGLSISGEKDLKLWGFKLSKHTLKRLQNL